MGKLKVTQTRSLIGRPPNQRRTIKALGLRKIRHSVIHEDNSTIRGMLFCVKHMVDVEELNGAPSEG